MSASRKPPELYTVEEAAAVLRMGRSTLYRLVRQRQVPHTIDPAGRIRFTDDDLTAALAEGHRPVAA